MAQLGNTNIYGNLTVTGTTTSSGNFIGNLTGNVTGDVSGNASTATKLETARTIDGVSFNGSTNITHYGSCSTAAGTAAKVVDFTGFTLATGARIVVKFTVTNTAANPTLNVNSTGAKAIYYRGSAISAGYLAANRTYEFVYNGTQYELIGDIDTNSNTIPQGYCSTGGSTAAKTVSCSGYTLTAKSYLMVIMTTANSAASALTLNVNGKGAKPIYINGSASSDSNYTLPAGSYLTYYDGTNYYFRTDGLITGNITGNAATATKLGTATVGGTTTPIYLDAGTPTALSYTISKSVPANAVFTDTKVTQTAVDPSGYTNYRPLVFGSSNGDTAGFTPTTITDVVYTCKDLYVRPSEGLIHGSAVENAVWNDLSDSIPVDDDCELEHGYCYCFNGERYTKSSRYLDEGIIGIHSDTYGFRMGAEEGKKKIDVAVAGFVLAYVDKEYKPGTPLTCTENGYLTEIKREDKIEYPERIVATYWKSESADEWGSESRKVKVNGRKWVKIV